MIKGFEQLYTRLPVETELRVVNQLEKSLQVN
jgi:hypothetical protein